MGWVPIPGTGTGVVNVTPQSEEFATMTVSCPMISSEVNSTTNEHFVDVEGDGVGEEEEGEKRRASVAKTGSE